MTSVPTGTPKSHGKKQQIIALILWILMRCAPILSLEMVHPPFLENPEGVGDASNSTLVTLVS
jgi:hypothetical protein